MTDLTHPGAVMDRLTSIEADLATRQNGYEEAARAWYSAQPEIRRAQATALLSSDKGTVTEKKAEADLAGLVCDGVEHEAEYEAQRAVIKVLETRSMICMSLLRAQGRS